MDLKNAFAKLKEHESGTTEEAQVKTSTAIPLRLIIFSFYVVIFFQSSPQPNKEDTLIHIFFKARLAPYKPSSNLKKTYSKEC